MTSPIATTRSGARRLPKRPSWCEVLSYDLCAIIWDFVVDDALKVQSLAWSASTPNVSRLFALQLLSRSSKVHIDHALAKRVFVLFTFVDKVISSSDTSHTARLCDQLKHYVSINVFELFEMWSTVRRKSQRRNAGNHKDCATSMLAVSVKELATMFARLLLQRLPKNQATTWRDLTCLLYTSPSPRDGLLSRMPSSA